MYCSQWLGNVKHERPEIFDIIYIIKGHLPSAAFDKSLLKHLRGSPNAFINSKTHFRPLMA